MLGKLFNLTSGSSGSATAAPTSHGPRPPSDSIQEELHTRGLLFPDTNSLNPRQDQAFPLSTPTAHQPNTSSTFDYDGEIDLDFRDVRVLIMQDSLGATNPALLFDSHPGPAPPTSERMSPGGFNEMRRNPLSPRKPSQGHTPRPLAIQPGSPQPKQSSFDRRSSFQTRPCANIETETQRASREYREELVNFTSCVFANTEVMSYKGTQTKVHIIPSDWRPEISSSYVGDGRGSMGRTSMRSSRLAQSFTCGPAAGVSSTALRQSERKKVLVTRLFPVNLMNDDLETLAAGATPHSRASEDGSGFPFPYSPDESGMKKKKPTGPKQKRTPMYAVALVIQLPPGPAGAIPTGTKPASTFKGPGSYPEQQSFPSSCNSARRSGWSIHGSGFGAELLEATYSNDVEDRMDAITQHWDIIMRTLTNLQSIVATALHPMLKQADKAVPDPLSIIPPPVPRNSSTNNRRGSNPSQTKPPKTNAKLVALSSNCLMLDSKIEQEVEAARIRIVTGLRATRVVTGQGRWGPWRDEARWVAKWAAGKEQGFFFFNLLTGFLAIHNDWLQALSPLWYRKRHYQQQKAKSEEDTSLPSRTIIVSKNKMAARRLVFLLSAFLPASQHHSAVRLQRPVTSASFSHSPPSYIVPILKEELLRRKINRRTGARGGSHNRSFSIQSQATTRSATGIPAQLAHLSIDENPDRRASDATVSKPSDFPFPSSELTIRKSGAAAANTVTPDAIIHFTTGHGNDTVRAKRPGSSGSTVADDLKRTLQRDESTGHASTASNESRARSSNWGSMISGLWGTRRRDSTAASSRPNDLYSNRDSPLSSPTKPTAPRDKLSQMVKELSEMEDTLTKTRSNEPGISEPEGASSDTQKALHANFPRDQTEPPVKMIDPTGAYESPVKTSINVDDGVIDVDVQFPDYLTSFESAISSPSSSGYLSTPGLGNPLDGFEQFSRIAVDGEAPLNVAGWLQDFHPDFSLQAIPPQADLLLRVEESLRAEPTPSVHPLTFASDWETERWVDVSSALIADTTNFTIKRLRFRRLVKPKCADNGPNGSYCTGAGHSHSTAMLTPALTPYEQPIQEKVEVDDLVALDPILIEAVEKVIAQSNHASRTNSVASSRSVSKRRGDNDSVTSMIEPATLAPEAMPPLLNSQSRDVHRAECKTVVLSALEGIVQSVVDEREQAGDIDLTDQAESMKRERESALRTAIRAWLENVELGEI